jgi:cell division septation protein DedD
MATARVLPLLIALLLGVGASLLVACGGTRGGVPAAAANGIVDDLDAVRQAVDAGDCQAATTALARVRQEVQGLPASTSKSLVDRLQRGVDNLQRRVPSECRSQGTTTTDTTPTDTTPTDTTPTDTMPTDTTPSDTTPTDTTPTDTTPTDTTPTDTTPTTTTPTDTTPTDGGSGGTGGTSPGSGGGTGSSP